MSNFSERLVSLMKEDGLNSETLAAKIGVSSSMIRRWSKYDYNASLSGLVCLANYFECSIDYLVGRSDDYGTATFKQIPPFGEQIKMILEETHATIYDICKHTTFDWQTFNSWYKGSVPKLNSLVQLADYFNISIDMLVGRI